MRLRAGAGFFRLLRSCVVVHFVVCAVALVGMFVVGVEDSWTSTAGLDWISRLLLFAVHFPYPFYAIVLACDGFGMYVLTTKHRKRRRAVLVWYCAVVAAIALLHIAAAVAATMIGTFPSLTATHVIDDYGVLEVVVTCYAFLTIPSAWCVLGERLRSTHDGQRCWECGYDLAGLQEGTDARCPECGQARSAPPQSVRSG